MKILKVLGILFIVSLFGASTVLATGTEPSGNYNVYPTGQAHPQTFVIHITNNPSSYSYRAFATCSNGVGGSLYPNIYGSWHNGETSSQTPDCSSIYGKNALIQVAGFYFDKSQNIRQTCYAYGRHDSGSCPITP